jgi:hypothetical protein
MAIDRRAFLIGTGLILAPGAGIAALARDEGEAGAVVSACQKPDGSYAIVALTLDGRIVREIPLEARGHDIALHRPSGRTVAFARRPGTFALALDSRTRREPVLIGAPLGRYFCGHGVFSKDGRLLYATESNSETGQGLLGIYDVAAQYRRVGEMATHGIDPHEVILLADGRTLAVANGGIEESGRVKLNISTMDPSLCFIDADTGALKVEHHLPPEIHKLSIRHLAVDKRVNVWFGGQWEGDLETSPELIGRASLDRPLSIIAPDAPRGVELRGYIGAVAISGDGETLAVAAPRAGRIVYVATATGAIAGETVLADGCGLAGIDNEDFIMSSGHGIVQREHKAQTKGAPATFPGFAFDNHLKLLG